MAEIPSRGAATTWLTSLLRARLDEIGVGDGIAPERYGWPSGQPGVSSFKPYTVVKSLRATPQSGPQPLATAQSDAWWFPYQLTGWGELREQADWVCDQVNMVVASVDPKALNGDDAIIPGFSVQQIVLNPLGSTDRDDKTSPATWSRTDICTLWLARAQPRRRG